MYIGSSNLTLPIVVPTIVGVVLVVPILLMPKGFFLNLASEAGVKFNKSDGKARS
jgi:ABC-type sulfate transport system permease component